MDRLIRRGTMAPRARVAPVAESRDNAEMSNRMLLLLLVAGALSAGPCASAAEPRVAAALLSDRGAIAAGDVFRVGILFKIPERAHIYWLNPGESGLPTAVEWRLPSGFEVGELQWPVPLAIHDEVLHETSYGYEREVLLFSEVRSPTTLDSGGTFRVAAEPSWLVCLEDGMCIPEDAALDIDITVADATVASGSAGVFDAYAPHTPRAAAEFSDLFTITSSGGGQPTVRILPKQPWRAEAATCVFFPAHGGPWKASAADPNGARGVEWIPFGPLDGNPAGALYLTLTHAESEEQRSVYVRIGG